MKPSTHIDYNIKIQEALAYLANHLTEEVNPVQLARVLHLSPFHFHRIFRGITGESVMGCLRRLRLESAALRLRRSEASVIEAALDVGFESHEGFTRAFKQHFGVSPQLWRKQEVARMSEASQHEPRAIPEVELRNSRPQNFIAMHHVGSFADIQGVWTKFLELAVGAGLFNGHQQLVGRYPDDPEITPDGRVRFDVGMISDVTNITKHEKYLKQEILPGGLWAVAVHRGSYANLSQTYLQLVGGWFPRSGRALDDRPCLEFYLNSPANTAEEDLLTEVWAPIAL